MSFPGISNGLIPVSVCARALPQGISLFFLFLFSPAAATIDDDNYCDQPDDTCNNADDFPSGTKAQSGWGGQILEFIRRVLMVLLLKIGSIYAHGA